MPTSRTVGRWRWTLALVVIAGCGGADDGDRVLERDGSLGDAAATDGGAIAAIIDAAGIDAAVIDAAVIDAAVVDAGQAPPDGDGCAVASVASWAGTSHHRYDGSGGYDQTAAEVRWDRVATVSCVDRYQPSGTATWDWFGGLCQRLVLDPTTHPIASSEGVLVVDRNTAPATYTVDGATRWPATITCTVGDPPVDEVTETEAGGVWIDATGVVVDALIEGTQDEGNRSSAWRFAPAS